LFSPIISLILENDIDILALVEGENLDKNHLIIELGKLGHKWKQVKVLSNDNICLFAKKNIKITAKKEEDDNFSCYKVWSADEWFLLFVLHLDSAMFKDEDARSRRAISLSNVMRRVEEISFKKDDYRSIVVGDFNLQPYSAGIAGIDGFNATMSCIKAKEKYRLVKGNVRWFYFNPTWNVMGKNTNVQGSYYNNNDQKDLSMYWYNFDEVLIRPYFVDKFQWDSFKVIEKTAKYDFIKGKLINKKEFSDHLPLVFEII
jgi:hypothetical protein